MSQADPPLQTLEKYQKWQYIEEKPVHDNCRLQRTRDLDVLGEADETTHRPLKT